MDAHREEGMGPLHGLLESRAMGPIRLIRTNKGRGGSGCASALRVKVVLVLRQKLAG